MTIRWGDIGARQRGGQGKDCRRDLRRESLSPHFLRGEGDTQRSGVRVRGGPAWEKARFISFTFNLERNGQPAAVFPQQWDRLTGDYRVSGNDPKGVPFVVVENVNTKAGKAWQNGVPVTDPAALQNLLTLG